MQDDAKEQEPSGMWPFIIGGWDKVECLQNGPYNDKKWDSHEKMIFFGFRAGLTGYGGGKVEQEDLEAGYEGR